jgi:hypothetical protein
MGNPLAATGVLPVIAQFDLLAVVAQFDPDPIVGNPVLGVAGAAVSAFFSTLVVGAIMVTVAPGYTERMMQRVLEDPVGSFAYGVVALLVLIVLIVALVLTIIGIVVVVPLALVASLVWAVGAAIAYLAIAERIVGRDDGWLVPLVVAASINGAVTLTGIGGIVSFCVGAAGFGAILRNWLA